MYVVPASNACNAHFDYVVVFLHCKNFKFAFLGEGERGGVHFRVDLNLPKYALF